MKKNSPTGKLKLSLREARQIAIQAQRLSQEKDALSAVRHLGYVQIDTISVVARAHHHVLWSRVPEYVPSQLDVLQKQRKIFEYWYHAASYLPIEDYRYSLVKKGAYRKGKSHWFEHDKKLCNKVLARIRAEGPLQAKDFDAPKEKRSGPWFDWKPAKRALEQLFMAGHLMVSERKGFQKVYDLTERVLPKGLDTSTPNETEYAEYLIRTTLRSHGLALEPEMRYLRRGSPLAAALKKTLKKLEHEGTLIPVQIKGLEDLHFFSDPQSLNTLLKTNSSNEIHILSPFDPVVIQRKRVKSLFDFDYQIECYTPAPKRKYGYFCLPVLWKNQFIGRLDLKADRKSKILRVISSHIENPNSLDFKLLESKLQTFARFNGCDSIALSGSTESSES